MSEIFWTRIELPSSPFGPRRTLGPDVLWAPTYFGPRRTLGPHVLWATTYFGPTRTLQGMQSPCLIIIVTLGCWPSVLVANGTEKVQAHTFQRFKLTPCKGSSSHLPMCNKRFKLTPSKGSSSHLPKVQAHTFQCVIKGSSSHLPMCNKRFKLTPSNV